MRESAKNGAAVHCAALDLEAQLLVPGNCCCCVREGMVITECRRVGNRRYLAITWCGSQFYAIPALQYPLTVTRPSAGELHRVSFVTCRFPYNGG